MGLRRRARTSLAVAAVAAIGLFGVGCTSGSGDATPIESAGSVAESADGLSIGLARGGDRALQLGEPLEATLTIGNPGARSVSAAVELVLQLPDGTEVPFHRTSLFVPHGESSAETVTLTTSRWTAATGEFHVVARMVDEPEPASPSSLAFDVVDTTRTIPVFEDVTAQAGVATTVPAPVCGQFANGAAWGDVDGDGWPDLVVTRLGDPVQLFVNRGDGTFADEGRDRGVVTTGANGAAFADYDGDGDGDLVLVGDGPDTLLRNDGTGHFDDVTAAAGVAGDPADRGMSASWGDFDDDGFLDLYVTNYMECTGDWSTAAEIIEQVGYHPDVLYRNEGDGSFTDVTAELPDSERTAAGFAAAWLDVDDDGLLDLYLGNDFVGPTPDHNRLWRNAGAGSGGWTFEDVSLDSGAGLFMNTMGIGIGDVDRDGDVDLALSDIGGNVLLRNTGDGTFVEETDAGIERPAQGIDHATVTWGSVIADLDLDGWEDLFMAAGNLPQGPDVPIGAQPDMVFLNDGTGLHFLDVSALTGVDDAGDSKGVAAADFDRDGDVDLFVIEQDGAPRLYRNVTPRAGRHWLEVDLVGTVSNRDGCGATIRVTTADGVIERVVLCGSGGTGSGNERRVHVGLGTAASIDAVEIAWPSGTRQVVDGVAVDAPLTVVEPAP